MEIKRTCYKKNNSDTLHMIIIFQNLIIVDNATSWLAGSSVTISQISFRYIGT